MIWRELFRFRVPTIVLWRGAYGALPHRNLKKLFNVLVKSLLPFRRVLLARALRDLSHMLDADLDGVRSAKSATEEGPRAGDLAGVRNAWRE